MHSVLSNLNSRMTVFDTPKRVAYSFFEWFGELGVFCARLLRSAVAPPYEGRELLRQMDEVGTKSLPLVAAAGAATGAVIALQTHASLARFGATSLIPAVIFHSLLEESGPIITGLMVAGRVGAAIGAELGSMKVTEQIDAMEASAVDPFKYLVATRVVACVLMMPLLTLSADLCGVLTGWLMTSLTDPVSLTLFVDSGLRHADFNDFLPPTFKTLVFGLIIGVIACFQGMRTRGGATGVGKAATGSVVLSSLFLVVADVLLVKIILALFP
ncbi:MAG: ABC transporter permease [Acidobacteria bacterium]|nr:ABC transporter permease [Acidobacteriota bacterium]